MNKSIPHQIGSVVRPEDLARKLAAIHNYEDPELLRQIEANPRIPEILWYLQAMSLRPGGLARFVEALVNAVDLELFGTRSMRCAQTAVYTFEQKVKIWEELPCKYRPESGASLVDPAEGDFWREERPTEKERYEERAALVAYLKPWTDAYLRQICKNGAQAGLPAYLHQVCVDVEKPFKPACSERGARFDECWYMDDPLAAVAFMMDLEASKVNRRLAHTAVSAKVFDALDYAFQERAMVRIEGDSRFGKTEAVRAWCDMRPGLARLVRVPSANGIPALMVAIADALGMETSYGSRTQRLRERIEYVLKHSGLFLVLDEAAFLLPQSYAATTAPARLNWVRTEIVDRGLPLALVVTPQDFVPAAERFRKKTGYAMEQFFGRIHRVVRLPSTLSEKDLVAVAKIHFNEMDDQFLSLIATYAECAENYLQAAEAIAKLARYNARKTGCSKMTLAIVESAIAEVIPSSGALATGGHATAASEPADTGEAVSMPVAQPKKRHFRGSATPVKSRSFDSCSLREVMPKASAEELSEVGV